VRVRQGGNVQVLSIDGAGRIADAPPELADLARIIAEVRARHAYLLGPVEE